MVQAVDGSEPCPRMLTDGDTLVNLIPGSLTSFEIQLAAAIAATSTYGAVGAMAAAGVAAANSVGTAASASHTDHVHAMPYSAVKTAIGAADSALGMNSQKVSALLAGTAATDAAAVSQLSDTISYTPGVSTSGFCDVVCAVLTAAGAAPSVARQVIITAIPATEGAGNGLLAAATSAVGTVLKSLNPAAGAHTMSMDTGATGLFSFKMTDGVNEAVVVRIEVDGCKPIIKKITVSGN